MNPISVYENPIEQFPLLGEMHSPPQRLFIRGNGAALRNAPCLAVVGTRRASPYGLHMAWSLARELSEAGVLVVSGLALGIDAAAHQGALRGGGKTAAVLGHGLDQIYPRENSALAQNILNKGGALISEYPSGAGIQKHHFPQRNRIVAALCLGVVVIEAPMKSGALITARLALSQNREVFAVPGPANQESFSGCHWLIQQGAKLVTSVEDILDEVAPSWLPTLLPAVEASWLEKKFQDAGGFFTSEGVQRLAAEACGDFWELWGAALATGRIEEINPHIFAWASGANENKK